MTKFLAIFSLDVRSVRLFRFSLGILILVDLASRLENFTDHYLSSGLLPLSSVPYRNSYFAQINPFMWSSSPIWVGALFGTIGLLALILIADRFPRTTSFALWFMLLSLSRRNPFIGYSADSLMQLGLLWSAFIPRAKKGESSILSVGTAAVVLQVVMLYFSAGLHKDIRDWWYFPHATYLAVSSDMYGRPFGRLLMGFPNLMQYSTMAVFLIERFAYFLFLSPWRNGACRILGIAVFGGMHMAFTVFMNLGFFPYIDVAILLALLPRSFWDRLGVAADFKWNRSLPNLEYALQSGAFALLAVSIFKSAVSVPMFRKEPPRIIQNPAQFFNLRQQWAMFYPSHAIPDGYYKIIGYSEDDRAFDLLEKKSVETWIEKPENLYRDLGGMRPLRLLDYARHGELKDLLTRYGRKYCRELLEMAPPPANWSRVEIMFVRENTVSPQLPVAVEMDRTFSANCLDAAYR
ncbi:MAG: hypothetical protein AB7F86_01575 [Bdellovibrionales bacterium]